MEENLKNLYDNLVSGGYELPDYDTFAKDMTDTTKANRLYDTMTKDGYEVPANFDDFYKDISPVKKEPLLPSIVGGLNESIAKAPGETLKAIGIGGAALGRMGVPLQGTEAEKTPSYQLGQKWNEFIDKLGVAYVAPEHENNPLVQLARGIGQVGSMILMRNPEAAGTELAAQGVVQSAPKLAAKEIAGIVASPAGVLAGTYANPEFEEAKKAGLSEDEAFKVWLKNYFINQTDPIPIENAFIKLNKLFKGSIAKKVYAVGESGVVEGLQEGVQQYLSNQVAKEGYDPDRDPMFGVLESMGYGFIIGSLLPGAAAFLTRAPKDVKPKLEKKFKELESKAVYDEQQKLKPKPIPEAPTTGDPSIDIAQDQQVDELLNTKQNLETTQESSTGLAEMGKSMAAAMSENLRERWREDVRKTGKLNSTEEGSLINQVYEKLVKRGLPREESTINTAINITEQGGNTTKGVTEQFNKFLGTLNPQQNAIQEQIPNEGVLRPEESQPQVNLGLQEMGQGNTEPQTVTEAKQEKVTFEQTPEYQKADQLVRNIADEVRSGNKTMEPLLREAIQSRDNARIAFEQKGRTQSPIKAGFQEARPITLEEKQLLNKQIKDFARGVREGRMDEKRARVDLANDIRERLDKQQVPVKQRNAIINRLSKVNLLNPVQVRRVQDYTQRVVEDAQYSDRVDQANDLSEKIKSKIKKFTPEQKPLVRDLTKINPSDVEDINEHLSVLGSVLATTDSPLKDYVPMNAAEVGKYVQKTQGRIDQFETTATEEAAIEEGVTEDNTEENLRVIAGQRKKNLSPVKVPSGIRGEVHKLLNEADPSKLDKDMLVKYIKGVDNVTINGDYGNLGEVAAAIAATNNNFSKLAQAPGNINGFTESAYQWAEILHNLGKSSTWAADVNAATNINNVHGQNSQTQEAVDKFALELNAKARELKKKYGEDVMSREGIVRMAQFAELVQSKETEDVDEGFDRSKKNIETDLTQKKPEDAKFEAPIFEPLRATNSVDEAIDFMKKNHPAEFEFWQEAKNKFESIYDEFAANSEIIYGKKLPKYRNYTPLVTRLTESGQANKVLDEDTENYQTLINRSPVKPKESKTAMARADRIGPQHYRDRDFVANILDRYQKTIYDSKVSFNVLKTRELLRTPEFAEMVRTEENKKRFVTLFNNQIKNQRGIHASESSMNKWAGMILSEVQKAAYIRALGGLTAGISQASSSLSNTVTQLALTNPADIGFLFQSHPGAKQVRDQYTISDRMRRMGGLRIDETIDAKAKAEFSKIKALEDIKAFYDEKLLPKIMASFSYGDVKPAEMAWNAYYLQRLKQLGVDVSGANTQEFWDNETSLQGQEERQRAAAYAEQKVDENLLTSQQEKMATIVDTRGNLAASTIKATMFPFVSYTLNLKNRIANRVWQLATGPNKGEAMRDLVALMFETAIFSATARYVISPITDFTKEIWREFFDMPDPGDDKEREEFQDKLLVTNIANNINPLAINEFMGDLSADMYNRLVYKFTNTDESYDEWKKENSNYIQFTKPTWQQLGMISIALDLIDNVWEGTEIALKQAAGEPPIVSHTDKWGNTQEKYLTEGEARAVKWNAAINLAAMFGLGVRELTNTSRAIKKEALRESGGSSSGGGLVPPPVAPPVINVPPPVVPNIPLPQ